MNGSATVATARMYGSTIIERIRKHAAGAAGLPTEHLPGVQIVGKAEWYNPGGIGECNRAGKVVDCAGCAARTAALYVNHGGRGLLDATSGNTGIAYAMLGAALIFGDAPGMPSNVSG